jgi:GTPase SAR1 family protein
MSQVQDRPAMPLPRGALRIVLFGMPDAGKSSLLGALAEAAETQPHGLRARLIDLTQGLDQLRHYLYEGQPTRTSDEVVPYPVTVQPFLAEGSSSDPPAFDLVLVDCDGQVANQFLSRQRSLTGGPADSPLRDAILQADTLILAVDASASPEVVRRDFGQFARFLRLLEQSRSQRTEVTGLPAYLVLTKCDLLAKQGDSLVSWMERIEEHKRQVDRMFQEYLAQHAGDESQPFGKIELHLWATAVKHPALQATPARPREPYGVAELFRQCLRSAESYRAVQAHAGRRLRWTVGALAGIVALLVVLGLFFYANRLSPEAGALDSEIRVFRSAQGDTPAERFREPLDDKVRQLKRFEADPAFAQVTPDLRQYVEDYRQELEAYQRYRKELLEGVKDPRFIHTDAAQPDRRPG